MHLTAINTLAAYNNCFQDNDMRSRAVCKVLSLIVKHFTN